MKHSQIMIYSLSLSCLFATKSYAITEDITKSFGIDFINCVESSEVVMRERKFNEFNSRRTRASALLFVESAITDTIQGKVERISNSSHDSNILKWEVDFRSSFSFNVKTDSFAEHRCYLFGPCGGWNNYFRAFKPWKNELVTGTFTVSLVSNSNTEGSITSKITDTVIEGGDEEEVFVQDHVVPELETSIQNCVNTLVKFEQDF